MGKMVVEWHLVASSENWPAGLDSCSYNDHLEARG
jgi:hypothetical protein